MALTTGQGIGGKRQSGGRVAGKIPKGGSRNMAAFNINVYRQQCDGASPAPSRAKLGKCLAGWGASYGGMDWIWDLQKEGKLIHIAGGGYPGEFTAQAEHVVPYLKTCPSQALPSWSYVEGSGLPLWLHETDGYPEIMDACRPDEWLIIRVWDQS